MSSMMLGRLLGASAALALAACGGGGGGDLVSTPTPMPTPTPTPTPTPAGSPVIFPAITTNTNFAVLGLEADAHNTPASALARNGFSVRYDSAAQGYFIDLPSTDEFQFESSSENAAYWTGFAATGFYTGTIVNVFKPRATNPEIQLTYTSFGVSTGYYTTQYGFFAFGSATPGSGVPVTGTATYDAFVRGGTLNSFAIIGGNATLQFNFGAGTLGGHFDPTHELNGVVTSLGRYDFVNTVFGVGSTTYSGSLSRSGINTLGAFDGRFTGPAAQELMARWTAPYLPPGSQQVGEMFGVWVGKKQ